MNAGLIAPEKATGPALAGVGRFAGNAFAEFIGNFVWNER